MLKMQRPKSARASLHFMRDTVHIMRIFQYLPCPGICPKPMKCVCPSWRKGKHKQTLGEVAFDVPLDRFVLAPQPQMPPSLQSRQAVQLMAVENGLRLPSNLKIVRKCLAEQVHVDSSLVLHEPPRHSRKVWDRSFHQQTLQSLAARAAAILTHFTSSQWPRRAGRLLASGPPDAQGCKAGIKSST